MNKNKTIDKKVVPALQYQTDHGLPYIIKIQNTTDDKHYNVPVFNMEHEKNKSIRWKSGIMLSSYNEILAQKNADAITGRVGKVMIITECDYKKFELRQMGCPFILSSRDSFGNKTDQGEFVTIDPYQQRSDCVVCVVEKYNFHLKCLSDIVFEYLMPETSIELRLYMQRAILPKK